MSDKISEILREVEEARVNATPGPWRIGDRLEENYLYIGGYHVACMGSSQKSYLINDDGSPNEDDSNAALAVATVNHWPTLAAAYRAKCAEVERLREELDGKDDELTELHAELLVFRARGDEPW